MDGRSGNSCGSIGRWVFTSKAARVRDVPARWLCMCTFAHAARLYCSFRFELQCRACWKEGMCMWALSSSRYCNGLRTRWRPHSSRCCCKYYSLAALSHIKLCLTLTFASDDQPSHSLSSLLSSLISYQGSPSPNYHPRLRISVELAVPLDSPPPHSPDNP